MQEANSNSHPDDYDNEIDLFELFHVLFEGKWIIVSLTALVSILGLIYSLLLPNIYVSKALLVPVNISSGISRTVGNYQSIAGLAGINIPSSGSEGNSEKAIKTLNSLSFFEKNILPNIYLPDLMAVKSWNSQTNKVVYDESIFEIDSNTWKQKPSAQQAFKVFTGKHLRLTEEKNSNFITLSIKHQSSFIAKQWADLVINEVNNFYRQKDKNESEKAVSYLNQQISMTGFSEIKQVLAQLLQEETKKLTLIEANQSYVFDYIDPPAVMEMKSEPKRAFICILSALFGGFLSIFLVLVRHYIFNKKVQ